MNSIRALEEFRRSYTDLLLSAERLHAALLAEAGISDDSGIPTQVRVIQAVVAKHYGMTVAKLLSPERSQNIAVPRQIAMALCRQYTLCTVMVLGRAFGLDHGTVIHACRAVQARRDTESDFNDRYIATEAMVLRALKKETARA